MNVLILFLLIIGVLFIAFTFLKGPRNTNINSDGFTTRPFGGGAAGTQGLPPELKDAEEDFEADMAEMDAVEEYITEEHIAEEDINED